MSNSSTSAQPRPNNAKATIEPSKGQSQVPTPTQPRASEQACFKCGGRGHIMRNCPNQKKVLFSQQNCYESFEDEEKKDTDRAYEEEADLESNAIDDEDIQALSLVTRRVLTVKEGDLRDQRENLFHTKCRVKDVSLSVIKDGGAAIYGSRGGNGVVIITLKKAGD